ncbi:MAG: DUF1761 domain-containing protein [Pseudomonadota bacterium]
MFAHRMKSIFRFDILGIPVLPTLAGGFVLMSTMFLWFGGVFVDRFQPLMGITEADVTATALGWWYPIGIALSMSQGLGLAILLKWQNWPTVKGAINTAFVASTFFGVTTFGYRLVIFPERSLELFFINVSGIIVAFLFAAITISLLRSINPEKDLNTQGLGEK